MVRALCEPPWLLTVNVQKSAVVLFRSVRMGAFDLDVSLGGEKVPQVSAHKHLGVTFSETLTWDNHMEAIIKKGAQRIGLLRRYRSRLPPLAVRQLYCACILPTLDYASIAWGGLSSTCPEQLERLQRRAARLISGTPRLSDTPHNIILARAGLSTLASRRLVEHTVLAFRFVNHLLPDHLLNQFDHWNTPKPVRAQSLRNAGKIRLPRAAKSILKKSPLFLSLSLSGIIFLMILSLLLPLVLLGPFLRLNSRSSSFPDPPLLAVCPLGCAAVFS